MSWGYVAAGVGSLAGGYMSAQGSKKAGEATSEGQEAAAQLIRDQAEDAKRIIFQTVPIAERNLRAGSQGALNVLGQSMQPRSDLMRGGNVAAQNTLLAGLGQQNNAILGTGIDMSQLQAYQGGAMPQVNYQLPEYESAAAPFQDELAQIEAGREQTAAQGNQVEDTVRALYKEMFGREPSPSGLAIYSRTITEGGDLVLDRGVEKARKAMMNSDEYINNQAEQTLLQSTPQGTFDPNLTYGPGDSNLNPSLLGRTV